jgi:rSAM/selenodomain-associated transferase 2
VISVIVPTLDEAEGIDACLAALAGQAGDFEIIVADGGSTDGTQAIAARRARLILAPRGRAAQMNAGAAAASGEVLLFLHADALLAAGALVAVAQALAKPGVVGGGFSKRYDGGGAVLAAVGRAVVAVRSGWRGRFVGTQGIFVRRSAFERLGGYREWPLLEDVDFSDRMRRAGRVVLLPVPITVSARRYLTRGVARQVAVNALVLGLFRLGVPPARLARLYRGGGE